MKDNVQIESRACEVAVSLDVPPKFGGAHLWLLEVMARWPQPVRIVTSRLSRDAVERANEIRADELAPPNLEIVRTLADPGSVDFLSVGFALRLIRAMWQLQRALVANVPRIHCVRSFPEGLLVWALTRANVKKPQYILYAHGEEITAAMSSRQLSFLARRIYRDADLVVCNSLATQELVSKLSIAARSVVVSPGVDFRTIRLVAGTRSRTRQLLSWSPDDLVLCSISRLEPHKNHSIVLRAIRSLIDMGYQVKYVCGGDGSSAKALRELCTTLKLDGSVCFAGPMTDAQKYEFLSAADIHIMPAIRIGETIEGYGIVFIEAAAAGIPSISGNIGGQPEAVLDGETGLVVDGSNLDTVTEAILTLVRDEELRKRMGENGLRHAENQDWQRVAARILHAVQCLS